MANLFGFSLNKLSLDKKIDMNLFIFFIYIYKNFNGLNLNKKISTNTI